jgi:hypothetical protein
VLCKNLKMYSFLLKLWSNNVYFHLSLLTLTVHETSFLWNYVLLEHFVADVLNQNFTCAMRMKNSSAFCLKSGCED